MRKTVILSLLCWFLSLQLPAQEAIQTRKFTDIDKLVNAIPVEEGYLILAIRANEIRTGGSIKMDYVPFYAMLDANLETVWERELDHSPHHNVVKLLAANDGYYILGEEHRNGDPNQNSARLIRISKSGDIEFNKYYKYPGFYGTEAWDMDLFPNGDLLLHLHSLRTYSSLEEAWLLRVSPKGEVKWKVEPGKGIYHTYGMAAVLANNTVAYVGGVNISAANVKTGTCEAYAYIFDADKPSKVLAKRRYTDFPFGSFRKILPMDNGGFKFIATAETPDDRKLYLVAGEMDANYKIVKQKDIFAPFDNWLSPGGMTWDPGKKEMVVVGTMGDKKYFVYEYTLRLTPDLRIVAENVGGQGSLRHITPLPDGTFLVSTADKLMITQ